jgi:hypothetical protein
MHMQSISEYREELGWREVLAAAATRKRLPRLGSSSGTPGREAAREAGARAAENL